MSRKNRQRRAANARRKRQVHRTAAGAGPHEARTGAAHGVGAPSGDVDDLVWAAVHASSVRGPAYDRRLGALAEQGDAAWECLASLLARAVAALWARGWTPSDVVALTSRRLSPAHADLAASAVAADGDARLAQGEALHPRWRAQLELVAARTAARLAQPSRRVALGVELLALVAYLPDLPKTLPAPGEKPGAAAPHGLDSSMLAKVQGLLAKAESTEFDAEAEALTAKAQELIARHAIAEVLLQRPMATDAPVARRIPVEDPYADAKSAIVNAVATANRCQAVWAVDAGWSSVFGFEADLDAVELLVASLLTQATAAMLRCGSRRGADGRSTTKSFRRSFLTGFAHRIGQRLCAATQGQVDAAAAGERLLPVLASRDAAVREAVGAAFPQRVRRATAVTNAAGWHAGQAAADLARLDHDRARLAS